MHKIVITALLSVVVPLSGFAAGPAKLANTPCTGNNFNKVTLRPGCSAVCNAQPCEVFFRMPPGRGSYRVFEGGRSIGNYPAGRVVHLGDFWNGIYSFRVEGANVRSTVLHISGGQN